MNRRRQLAVGFFSIVIVFVLGLIVYVANVNASQTVVVWVVKAPQNAGAAYTPDAVQPLAIKAQPNDFSFSTKVPDASGAYHFALGMSTGDIVRDNDLVQANTQVPINITITGTPAVVVGDCVDIYATNKQAGADAAVPVPTATATGPKLVAHCVPVSAAAAQTLTILVNLRLIPHWVALTATDTVKLYAVKTLPGTPVPGGSGGTTETVIDFLNSGVVSAGAGTGSGNGPAPSPTP